MGYRFPYLLVEFVERSGAVFLVGGFVDFPELGADGTALFPGNVARAAADHVDTPRLEVVLRSYYTPPALRPSSGTPVPRAERPARQNSRRCALVAFTTGAFSRSIIASNVSPFRNAFPCTWLLKYTRTSRFSLASAASRFAHGSSSSSL